MDFNLFLKSMKEHKMERDNIYDSKHAKEQKFFFPYFLSEKSSLSLAFMSSLTLVSTQLNILYNIL